MTSYWLLVALTELMMFELMSLYLYGDGVSYLPGVFVVTNQYVSNLDLSIPGCMGDHRCCPFQFIRDFCVQVWDRVHRQE